MGVDLKHYFEKAYCINLDREPEKWEQFQERLVACKWPFVWPTRISAIDGQKVPCPGQWSEGGGAYGCMMSHIRAIESSLNDGTQSLLMLEDDAEPIEPETFAERCERFLSAVPSDWAQVYLGGQFLGVPNHPPLQINSEVVIPFDVNRTHCFGLSQAGMRTAYLHLAQPGWWRRKCHIDHRLGEWHRKRTSPIYAPVAWLMQQAAGRSNICWRELDSRDWKTDPRKYRQHTGPLPWEKPPFYAIVGVHSSGSSAIAGVCYHLGMHLGDHLQGFYGKDPDKNCGFEARGLANICEGVAKFPKTSISINNRQDAKLREWFNYSWKRARQRGSVAVGGKYPVLCRLGPWIQQCCGDSLRVIHCVRPLEDSIQSLAKRGGSPKCTPEEADAVQRWLWEGKEELLSRLPEDRRLDVDFYGLLANPAEWVGKIAAFIGANPSQQQIDKAVAYVKPDHQHVGAKPCVST